MKESLLRYLVCPECRAGLKLAANEREGTEIRTGSLQCQKCPAAFPVTKGIPRFVSSDAYTRSFSFQWNVHRKTQVDSFGRHGQSGQTFQLKTGFDESTLKGSVVLDVGCGTGRFMEIAADLGAEVIGVDLSFAVDAAYVNMGRRDRIHIVQADLFKLPFHPSTFDAIYSIGVLHHTPDTKSAFLCLPPMLKRGGYISIWVYTQGGQYSEDLDRVRAFTTRLPKPLLYALCWAAVPLLHGLNKVPLLGRLSRRLPTSDQHLGYVWDVLDTFDLWSPRFQWRHDEGEVIGWFKEAHLAEIKALRFPVAVTGRKPH